MDPSLIVFSVVVPLVLLFANLVILAKFIDPQAASGHWVAKIMLVRARCAQDGAAAAELGASAHASPRI